MDAKTILGRFIRELREQAKLTQDQLARKTGITYQYLSGLENGRENFSIDILDALGKALDCPLPQLCLRGVRRRGCSKFQRSIKIISAPKVPLPPEFKFPISKTP